MVVLFPLAVLLFIYSCPGCTRHADPEARVLLLGLDGIEMEVLKPLLKKGGLPNIRALMDRGVYGYLQTFKPTHSPVIWTSIATGKTPMEHRITGFLDMNTMGPFTSNARKGKAIWNIAGDYGLKCNVAGYWMTWPAEKINGIMLSQISTKEQVDNVWKGMFYKDVENCTYPPEFVDEIWPVVERFQTAQFLDEEVLPEVFGDTNDLNPSLEVMDLIRQSKWSIASDFVYSKASEYILDKYPGDIDIVYIGGTDVIAHRFWRYREPDIYKYSIMEKYLEAFPDSIDDYYEIVDGMVGDLVALVPENTSIIIVSDHGMHADFLNGKDKGKKTMLSAHHLDAPPGVLIAAGQWIKKGPGSGALLNGKDPDLMGTVMDVTPTLLYLLDIPVGRDMKLGKVMKSVVSEELMKSRPVEYVRTHDIDFRPPTSSKSSKDGDRAFIERFEALGYIDGDSGRSVPDFEMGKRPK